MKFMMAKSVAVATLLSLAILAGCGGGGGGSDTSAAPATPTTTFPFQKAIAGLYTTGIEKMASATGTYTNGSAYPLTAALLLTEHLTNITATFAGQSAIQQTDSTTGNFYYNNQAIPVADTTQTYLTNDFAILGLTASDLYCIAQTPGQFPATVTVGQIGTIATAACYTDNTMATPAGKMTISYAISAGTSSTIATASVIFALVDITNQNTSSSQTNYLLDASGSLSFLSLSESATQNGVSLYFTTQ